MKRKFTFLFSLKFIKIKKENLFSNQTYWNENGIVFDGFNHNLKVILRIKDCN